MPLPQKRETMESAKARVKEALAPIWDRNEVVRDVQQFGDEADVPDKHRQHVFDFQDGLRLVVSRDRMPVEIGDPPTNLVIHVSASVHEESQLAGTLPQTKLGQAWLARIAAGRISELLDTDADPCPQFWSCHHVAHWFVFPEEMGKS